MNHAPPRLLAGITLLVWGGLTGNTTWGLVAALMLEARSWIDLRWEFTRASYIKAWQFCILVGALISMVAWINGVKAGKLHTLFEWAPLALLPLELAQRYGRSRQIPLSTFSFFARRKLERDIQQGRTVTPRMINTGYVYIATTVLATAMASRHDIYHFIGLGIVTGACLFFYVKNQGFRPWAWSMALLLALAMAFVGQIGMFKLYDYFTSGEAGHGKRTSANEARTSIGKLGRLKLSPKIFWRMQVHEGNTPKLLRNASYNHYFRTRWTHEFNPPPEGSKRDENDYIEDSDYSLTRDRDIRSFLDSAPEGLNELGHLNIIGEVNTSVKDNPIPLPANMFAIGDLGIEPDIFANSLGTVKISNPENHVINYTVWNGESSTIEVDPIPEFDLDVPDTERAAIRRIAKELGLLEKNLSTRIKIRRLRKFFNSEFRYSTHLETPRIIRGQRQSAVGTFLERTRSGHCEYFATATALLLRQAGVPTRYCTGFAVHEKDTRHQEWVMRGQHAHAWCRVWVEETKPNGSVVAGWEDIDLTPASWLVTDASSQSDWKLALTDWWQRLREDFLIWRTREANQTKVIIAITSLITLLVIWIAWRLWHSRQRRATASRPSYTQSSKAPTTALYKLERIARKKIGPRAPGTPLCQWLLGLLQIRPELEPELHNILELHSKIRFDPAGGSTSDIQVLTSQVKQFRARLKQK